jgi:hypothetical protein
VKGSVLLVVVVLLFSFMSVFRSTVSIAEASPDVFQGDLVIDGSNVTVIEGRFDINGSIVVMGNATLVLRNALVNFTQIMNRQFNVSFLNAADGNPRLNVENVTVSSGTNAIEWFLRENSTASISGLDMPSMSNIITVNDAVVSVEDSHLDQFWANGHSIVTVADSSATVGVNGYDSSRVSIDNCSLGHVYSLSSSNVTVTNTNLTALDYSAYSYSSSANASILGLKPRHVEYWNLKVNCSAVTGLGGEVPDFTLLNTEVSSWGFTFEGNSNVTVVESNLGYFQLGDSAVAYLNYSVINQSLFMYDNSSAYFYQSNVTGNALCRQNSSIWLYQSTISTPTINDQAIVLDCWFLDVQVKDGADNNVPGANVTAKNQATGRTQMQVTDQNGVTRLLLAEKVRNATGNFTISDYAIQAAYETHSNSTSVNVVGDQELTITLGDLVIPEFPLPLVILLIATGSPMIAYAAKRKRD